ncbi:hypothetical protein K438DRAFT_2181746 [Mycena galopus ATCC 62051]|nr:hypothetical protein K438DRAFT_2181746 [Mycena galopus ATCC 62051]
MYEHMLKHLKTHRDDNSMPTQLRAAATAGLDKLEFYYEKAKGCQFNAIATSESNTMMNELLFMNLRCFTRSNGRGSLQHCQDTVGVCASSSFLDDLSMIDIHEDASIPQEPEFKRFYIAACTYGRGKPNDPLAWWKACYSYISRVITQIDDLFACVRTRT